MARRNVAVLVMAQALLGAQMPILFVLGGLSGQTLAENKALATLPISIIVMVSTARRRCFRPSWRGTEDAPAS
jgi:hypothetical protein